MDVEQIVDGGNDRWERYGRDGWESVFLKRLAKKVRSDFRIRVLNFVRSVRTYTSPDMA